MILTEKQLDKRVNLVTDEKKAKPLKEKEFFSKKLLLTKENFIKLACLNPQNAANFYSKWIPDSTFTEEERGEIFWEIATVLKTNNLHFMEVHMAAVPDIVRYTADFLMLPIEGRPLPIHHELVHSALEKMEKKDKKSVILNYILRSPGSKKDGCVGIEYKAEVLDNMEYILTVFPHDKDINNAIGTVFSYARTFIYENIPVKIKIAGMGIVKETESYTRLPMELRANPYLAEVYLEFKKNEGNGSYESKSNYIYMPYVSIDEVRLAKKIGVAKGYDVTDEAIKKLLLELKKIYYGDTLANTIPKHFWREKKFAIGVLKDYPQAIAQILSEAADVYDKNDMLQFAKQNGMILQYITGEYAQDTDIIIRCIETTPESYLFVTKELKDNPEIIAATISNIHRIISETKAEQVAYELIGHIDSADIMSHIKGEESSKSFQALKRMTEEKFFGQSDVKEIEMISSVKFSELCKMSEQQK